MPAPSLVIDGQQSYGTPVITINSVLYKLNNINIDRGETTAVDRNENGKPYRQRTTADVATLTAEAQLATSSTAYPQFGGTFTVTLDANYGSETWYVLPQNFVATNGEGDFRVVPLRARLVLNPGSLTTVA